MTNEKKGDSKIPNLKWEQLGDDNQLDSLIEAHKEITRLTEANESLKVLLREADCPNDAILIDGFHYCCDEGELFSILNTDKLLGPCEWCSNRTELLGDEK